MKVQAESLPAGMRVRAPLGAAAATLLSLLLAACAGEDGAVSPYATGPTALKQPVRASGALAEGQASAGPVKTSSTSSTSSIKTSSIKTSSQGSAKTEKIVDLPFRPAVGSRWTGTSEKRETTTKGGQVAESTVLRERGEYRIAAKLEKGYQVSYTFQDGSMEGNSALIPLLTPMIDSMKGQSLTFETDEAGTPVRIVDVDKAKEVALKALDIVAQSRPELASVPQLNQVMDGMRAQYSAATPETGVALFLDEFLQYSMVQGLTNVLIGEERSYDDEVVNPLIGAKMRAKGSFRIASVDKAAGLATIEWRQTILPEDLNKASLEFAKRVLPNAGQDSKEFLNAMAQLKMDHLDRATYKVGLADGVVRRMDRTTVVKMQGAEKKTTVTMTMKPAA